MARHKFKQQSAKVARTPEQARISQWGAGFGTVPYFGWTVGALAGAIDRHNVGDQSMSARLWEDMCAHSWIRDALRKRQQVFTVCPIQFTPAGRTEAEQREHQRCCDFVREVHSEVTSLAFYKDVMRQELGMGAGAFAMDWELRTDGRDRWWLPKLKPWEPALLAYRQLMDERSTDGGAYVATTMSHGVVRVDHGLGYWGLVARRTGRAYLDGLVRVLGDAFVGDGYNFRDNQSHQDRYGRGIVQIKFPAEMRQEEVNQCASSLVDGGGGGAFLAPQWQDGRGVDADILRADGAGWQTFDATEKRILRRILIAMLGEDMSTTGSTGIAENDPRALNLWRIIQDDAATYGDAECQTRWEQTGNGRRAIPQWRPRHGVFREAIWKWVAYYNFGSFEMAPYVWWDATPPEDHEKRLDGETRRGQQRASALQAVSAAIKGFREQQVPHDPDHLAAQCGLSLSGDGDDDPDPEDPGGGSQIARDLDGVQVRISPAGAAFTPGHAQGIGNDGKPTPAFEAAKVKAKAAHEAGKSAVAALAGQRAEARNRLVGMSHEERRADIVAKVRAYVGQKNEIRKRLESHEAESVKLKDRIQVLYNKAKSTDSTAIKKRRAAEAEEAFAALGKHAEEVSKHAGSDPQLHATMKRRLENAHGFVEHLRSLARDAAAADARSKWSPPRSPPPKFSSNEEAHAYFQRAFPHHKIDLTGVHMSYVNAYATELHALAHEYPSVFKHTFTEIVSENAPGNWSATANMSGKIRLNLAYHAQDDAKQRAHSVEVGWLSTEHHAGVLAHEFGHILDFHMTSIPEHAVFKSVKMDPRGSGASSKYAKTNGMEMFAEAFAEMRHPSKIAHDRLVALHKEHYDASEEDARRYRRTHGPDSEEYKTAKMIADDAARVLAKVKSEPVQSRSTVELRKYLTQLKEQGRL